MKRIMIGVVVILGFQLCTSELNEIDGVIGDHIDGMDNPAVNSIIPAESFLGQYFSSKHGGDPISSRIENKIRHDFNSPVKNYEQIGELSAKWTGDFYFDSGNYEFTIVSDKNVLLKIDNEVLLNNSGNTNEQTFEVQQVLDGVHRIVVEYNLEENKDGTESSFGEGDTNQESNTDIKETTNTGDNINTQGSTETGGNTDTGDNTNTEGNTEPVVEVDNGTPTVEVDWTNTLEDPSLEDLNNESELFRPMGWAANTIGGANGEIIIVNNLNNDGIGSLKAAIEYNKARIIVFEVGGIIDLKGESLKIGNPFMTIMGQTAPEPGITLIKGGINIYTHDIIMQHIRVRPGENNQSKKSGWEVDGLSIIGGSNIIIDHCSISWATDENISASGQRFEGSDLSDWRKNTSHTITFSNNIIAECLNNSTHSKGLHSMGTLIHDNVTEMAIIGNIYASNGDRNPIFKGGTQGVIVNNYIYNAKNFAIQYKLNPEEWAGHALVTGMMSIVGNVLEKGPDSRDDLPFSYFTGGPVKVYWDDNTVVGAAVQSNRILLGNPTIINQPSVWPEAVKVLPSIDVKGYLLKNAGARPWDRDEVDNRIIREINEGKNRIIDSEKEVNGYPTAQPTYRKFDPLVWNL